MSSSHNEHRSRLDHTQNMSSRSQYHERDRHRQHPSSSSLGSLLSPPDTGNNSRSRSRSRNRKGAILIYDERTSEWFYPDGSRETRIIETPTQARSYRAQACFYDRFVYLSADEKSLTKNLGVHDFKADTWAITTDLHTPRKNHCAFTVAPGRLYIYGGETSKSSRDQHPIANVEWMDLVDSSDDQWHVMDERGPKRSKATATALVQTAYIMGGIDESMRPSPALNIYDAPSDRWFSGRALSEGRTGAACTHLGKCIILSGGSTAGGGSVTASCERYDALSDQWIRIADMHTPRTQHQLINCNAKLYALGGLDMNGRKLCTVEQYEESANDWLVLPRTMVAPHAQFTAVAAE